MGEHVDPNALSQLLEMTGDDRDFLAELIETFVADCRQQIAAMRAAIDDGRTEELHRAAHTLKGNAASFGAAHLAELSRALEADARSGMPGDAQSRTSAIERALESVEAELLEHGR